MKKQILWFDGACGIAGDMTVAALLDAGARREVLDTALASLGVNGFSYEILKDSSHGIAGTRFRVSLHGGNDAHAHGEHHHHEHAHRHLADIEKILERGALSDRARELALRAFRIVAEAEAKAHGVPVSEVHFHEVGAEDSVADIVGACALFDSLDVSECIVGELTEGSGTVVCAHGELPVPVPAVLNIAAAHGIPLRKTETRGELVTPTGIALAAAFRSRERLPEKFRVRSVGIGLGTREIGRANLLRAVLLDEETAAGEEESIFQLVSNIDDATGEMLGFAAEEIAAAGALDVCFVPCFMKKNRPAYQVQILAAESCVPAVEAALFRATTTIGVRKWRVERTCLEREIITAKLPFGDVRVKRCRTTDGNVHAYPEFDDVRALARKTNLPFDEIFNAAKKACDAQ